MECIKTLKRSRWPHSGLKLGDYERKELQPSTTFVMMSDLTITYIHYTKALGVVLVSKEMAELLK